MEQEEEKKYYKWDLTHVQDEFNVDSDVVLPSCEWKGRKLDLFSQMLVDLEKEEDQKNDSL